MPTFDGESYGLSIFFRIQGQIVASFFLGVCERTVERYISKFLVNGGVKPEPGGRSNSSISFAPREELIVFAYQIWKPRARSIQPKFPEISVQNSMDRFGPTGKVSKKLVHLLRWSSFPGRTGWNFG